MALGCQPNASRGSRDSMGPTVLEAKPATAATTTTLVQVSPESTGLPTAVVFIAWVLKLPSAPFL